MLIFMAGLTSLLFWQFSGTRLKTLTLLCWVQLGTSALSVDEHSFMICNLVATGMALAVFVLFPSLLPRATVSGAIGALVIKAIMNGYASFSGNGFSTFIKIISYDSLFVGSIYLTSWLNVGATLASQAWFKSKAYADYRRGYEGAVSSKPKTLNPPKVNKQPAAKFRPSGDPWLDFNDALMALKTEIPLLRIDIENAIEEISRLRTRQTVTLSIVGEFSSGKSTFINEVIGQKLLVFANDECTRVPSKISFGDKISYLARSWGTWRPISKEFYIRSQAIFDPDIDYLQANVDSKLLNDLDLELIDTPGASSKDPRYEARTLAAIEKSDACIVLMDSAQDGSKSFFTFLDEVRKRQKRVFLLLSRADMRSEAEIIEHLEITIPNLSARLLLSKAELHLVGLIGSNVVKTPEKVFQLIGESIRSQRGQILQERLSGLVGRIERKLSPTLAREEALAAGNLKTSADMPASFEELWEKWFNTIEAIPWFDIAEEVRNFCVGQHKLLLDKLTAGLEKDLDGVWFDDQKKSLASGKWASWASNQFEIALFGTLRTCLATHLKTIDEQANKSVFEYLECVHGVKQNNIDLEHIVFEAGAVEVEQLKHSEIEESIRLYLGIVIADKIEEGLAYETAVFKYDSSKIGRSVGMGGMLMGSGHPLLGLISVAVSAAGASSKADDQLLSDIAEWFSKSCTDRDAAMTELIIGLPNFTRHVCSELTEKLKISQHILFAKKFTETSELRDLAKKRLEVLSNSIEALEKVASSSKGGLGKAA